MPAISKSFTLEAHGILTTIRTPVTITSHSGKQAQFTAVWDTGANRTYVSQNVVDTLCLTTVKTASYRTASDTVICGIYNVGLLLPGGIEIENIDVFTFAGAPDCDVLIGMDVICHGDLAISNAANATWVSFRSPPDEEHIDFKSVL